MTHILTSGNFSSLAPFGHQKPSFISAKGKGKRPVVPVAQSDSFQLKQGSMPKQSPEVLKRPVLGVIDNYRIRDIALLYKKNRQPALGSPTVYPYFQQDAYVSHGQMVEAFAKHAAPEVEIRRLKVSPLYARYCDINPALEDALEAVQGQNRLDAVNLSFSVCAPLDFLREQLDLPLLTADTVHQYREKILKSASKLPVEEFCPELAYKMKQIHYNPQVELEENLILLQELSQKVPVYLAAGNRGKEWINLYSLIPNTHCVGATRKNNKVEPYSAQNSLVNSWASVRKKLVPILNTNQELQGFTLKDANEAPLKLIHSEGGSENEPMLLPLGELSTLRVNKALSWPHSLWRPRLLTGTSYASPQVAAKALQAKSQPVPQNDMD